MLKLSSSTVLFVHLLLASTAISSVLGAATPHRRGVDDGARITQCRVKRRGAPDVQVDDAFQNITTSSGTNGQPPTATFTEAAAPSPTVRRALPPFDYGNQKIRGVNLGGWFMMEVRYGSFQYLPRVGIHSVTASLLFLYLLTAFLNPWTLGSHHGCAPINVPTYS